MKRERTGSDEEAVVSDNEAAASAASGSDVEELNNLSGVRADRERLMGLKGSSVEAVLKEFNSWLKQNGHLNLHCKEERDSTAYLRCSCRRPQCYLVSLSRPSAPKKGRKEAREWSVNSIGEHISDCVPKEPLAVAFANTYIPDDVKQMLIGLWDQDVESGRAHDLAINFAVERLLPTTWEKSDVKNLFDRLRKCYSDDEFIALLESLSNAGHFVAVDLKTVGGKKTLNMALISFKWMLAVFNLFSTFASVDTTYAKNKLQIPVSFFCVTTNEAALFLSPWG